MHVRNSKKIRASVRKSGDGQNAKARKVQLWQFLGQEHLLCDGRQSWAKEIENKYYDPL